MDKLTHSGRLRKSPWRWAEIKIVSIQKWWILVQAKAAAMSQPEAVCVSLPRIAKSENAGMGRKMPFMDGHKLMPTGCGAFQTPLAVGSHFERNDIFCYTSGKNLRRTQAMIVKVIARKRLDDISATASDHHYWMTKTAEERIEAVELLRRQYHGDSIRLQRSARVVQQA